MKNNILFICVFSLFTSACSMLNPNGNTSEGNTYEMVSFKGNALNTTQKITLSWAENGDFRAKICNNINANIPLQDGTIIAKNAVMTRMACMGSQMSEIENTFVQGLNEGMNFRRLGINFAQPHLVFTTQSGIKFEFDYVAPSTNQ